MRYGTMGNGKWERVIEASGAGAGGHVLEAVGPWPWLPFTGPLCLSWASLRRADSRRGHERAALEAQLDARSENAEVRGRWPSRPCAADARRCGVVRAPNLEGGCRAQVRWGSLLRIQEGRIPRALPCAHHRTTLYITRCLSSAATHTRTHARTLSQLTGCPFNYTLLISAPSAITAAAQR